MIGRFDQVNVMLIKFPIEEVQLNMNNNIILRRLIAFQKFREKPFISQ